MISAHLDWWQNPANVMKGADLHPKDHSIQLFTDASNEVLNINWTSLTAYAYPPTALLHRVIQKIAPGWPGMPWFWDLVQLSTEIPLQLPVSTTLLKQSHNYVFHNNPQHLNLHAWCLGAERIAAPQRSSTRTIYKSKWALFEKWCRENSVVFPLHL